MIIARTDECNLSNCLIKPQNIKAFVSRFSLAPVSVLQNEKTRRAVNLVTF